MATVRLMTVEDLEAMPGDEFVYEVIDGQLVRREPVGGMHGLLGGEAFGRLWEYAKRTGAGRALMSETIYVFEKDPTLALRPDATFVRAGRLPAGAALAKPLELVPDLVVEVVSPNDSAEEVDEKIAKYRGFGVPLIWVLWPRRRAITVYAAGEPPRELSEGDTLDGGEILPGFQASVADLFEAGH